jgi:hypothetical protein
MAMKTTLDIPDDLAREVQRRADRDGCTPQQVIADVLAAGLPATADMAAKGGLVPKHLPLIKARPALPAGVKHLSGQGWADWLKDIEQQHEVERYEKAFGHQYVDRAGG